MTFALYDVRQLILDALRARLGDNRVHDGKVIDPVTDDGTPTGRIQPYVVVWFAPGTDPEPSAAAIRQGARHGFTATCAGMDPGRAAWCADEVMDVLLDRRLTGDGMDVVCTWPLGVTTAPPVREDQAYSPPRWFTPLPFDAHAV